MPIAGGSTFAALRTLYNRTFTAQAKSREIEPAPTIESQKQDIIMKGIQTNRLLRVLDTDQKVSMLQHMVPLHFEKGKVLFREGEPGNYFFVLESGECDVVNKTGDVVKTLHSGEGFGENGFILLTKRSATVKAKTPVQVHFDLT
jgi:signal-transduction protein with cAMP-binding, CBS, and nucleotidyltransferase domain